jgi:serine protease Do
MGSGFVIDEDGLIITNEHVVHGAQKLHVNFSDGRKIEATVVGTDPHADLAVIALQGKHGKLPIVKLGDSDDLMIGEWVIAIGNPFLNFFNDAKPTVTVGVVSALDRNFAPNENAYYQNMVQTDAAINPGNSGGPLVNALGEVVGINTFIYTGSSENRGSIGIGFAIPINRAKRTARELVKYGKKRPPWTGIAVQDLDRSLALTLGYNGTQGVVVAGVRKGSPGQSAGIREGDIIVQMGNRVIRSHTDIDGFFLNYFVGDTVRIVLVRKGKRIETKLRLEQYPGT